MEYAPRVARPAPQLRHTIEELRMVQSVTASAVHVERFPDGRSSLMLRMLHGGQCDISVAGPRSRALFKTLPACESAILIEFKPGAALPIFGLPVEELTDRIVSLEQIWGADGARLCEQLRCEQGEARRIERLEHALLERMAVAPEPSSARLARRAVRLLESGHAPARIEALAAELGVTARHLRRAFRQTVGVGPKEFARMVRLQRALRTVDSASSWSELATSAGYYDQAHLIAEFRALVGTTPGALQARRRLAAAV